MWKEAVVMQLDEETDRKSRRASLQMDSNPAVTE
jgi:hypothetical protein